MSWYEKIIAAHLAVTDAVSHGGRMEDGAADLEAGNRHIERAMTGTTDLFTKIEFDPWKEALEASFNASPYITWRLNSVQYEEETGFWHYEWAWGVR